MHIRLSTKRNKGSLLLGVFVILLVAVGGCVVIKKVISQGHKLKEKIDQAATNCPPDIDEVARFTLGPGTKFGDPPMNAVAPTPSLQCQPAFRTNCDTNYNEALEDESGF